MSLPAQEPMHSAAVSREGGKDEDKMATYQVLFGLFVSPGREDIRDYVTEAESPEQARTLAIEALHKGEEGGIYSGPLSIAQAMEEVPPQGSEFRDVSELDTRRHPKFAINGFVAK